MRPIFLLITLFYCAIQNLQAQSQPIQSPKLAVQSKVRAVDLSLKPELNFNGEPQQIYRSPQSRVVLLSVRNTGPVVAGNFTVEVIYNWRVASKGAKTSAPWPQANKYKLNLWCPTI